MLKACPLSERGGFVSLRIVIHPPTYTNTFPMHISYFLHGPFFFFLFWNGFLLFFGHTIWHVRSWFPNQGSNLCSLCWKLRVLTTGPLGKSFALWYPSHLCVLFMVSPTKLSVLWGQAFYPQWCLAHSVGSVNVCRMNRWMSPRVNDWAHIFLQS